MQAIILAAGMGRRLGEYTADNTKCMLEVNGIRLIDRMLAQLFDLELERVVIVVGYEGDKLKNYILQNYPGKPIVFVENKVYDKTNNIYSLWLAREYMAESDTILLESDLIFEDNVLKSALTCKDRNVALISKYENWMDGTMVKIDENRNIINFVPKADFKYSDTESYYKTVNIYKFSKDFIVSHYLPFLDAYIRALGENEYYEQVLRVLTIIDKFGLKALPITGMNWYEIDDVQDLRIAETIFASPE
ncbi:MAG: phosphocholine cytidylyltransferase family protein, partial [Muribaculaceae bacterium]|nr:phosphocholine cytidylyltransferase family protein [Muribaculaceae bacterium]